MGGLSAQLIYFAYKVRQVFSTSPKGKVLNRGEIGALVRSKPEVQVFLHRTAADNARNILKSGLSHALNITSTATWSPQDMERALKNYQTTHKCSTHVVIIEFPFSDADISDYKRKGNLDGIDGMVIDLLDRVNQGKIDTIPPRYIRGHLEVATGTFFPNPRFNSRKT